MYELPLYQSIYLVFFHIHQLIECLCLKMERNPKDIQRTLKRYPKDINCFALAPVRSWGGNTFGSQRTRACFLVSFPRVDMSFQRSCADSRGTMRGICINELSKKRKLRYAIPLPRREELREHLMSREDMPSLCDQWSWIINDQCWFVFQWLLGCL